MPVDDRVLAGAVIEVDQEPLAGIEEQAVRAVRLADAEHRGGLAEHLQGATLDDEAGGRLRCGQRAVGRGGNEG